MSTISPIAQIIVQLINLVDMDPQFFSSSSILSAYNLLSRRNFQQTTADDMKGEHPRPEGMQGEKRNPTYQEGCDS